MGRTSMSKERRLQIVQSLQKVMATRGYEKASVKVIASEAGLNSGLVHHYFANKQEILFSLIELLGQRLQERYEEHLSASSTEPQERLFGFIDAFVGLGPRVDLEAVACWVAIGSEAIRQTEVQEIYRSFLNKTFEQLKLLLTEVLASEGRQIGQVTNMASGLLAAIEGSYKLAMAVPGLTPTGFAAPTLKQMALGLIAQQPLREERS